MLDKQNKFFIHFLLGLTILFMGISLASAQQTGATVTNISHTTKGSVQPDFRNDTKGTINTVILTAIQQDMKWKAYVGNVSSTFVLDDANDHSIYRWNMDSFSGQVYITRNNSITWGSVDCATAGNKATEDSAIGHVSTRADSVNRTFVSQIHRNLTVGARFITNDTCYSIATWQNNTQPTLSKTIPFQELLLWDGSHMVYATFVENDKAGYRNDTPKTTYDFQAIVPDDGQASNPALRYYFYLELS